MNAPTEDREWPSASAFVWALVAGLPSEERGSRRAMILEAYLDDSGSGGARQRFFMLAGFISDYSSWATFADEWTAVLNEPPTIPYFKMHYFYNPNARKSVFKGWDRSEIDKKTKALISVIKYHVMVRVSSMIKVDDYETHMKGRVDPSIDSPYFPCFYQNIYASAIHQQKHGWNYRTDFFFDEQGEIGNNTKLWHDLFKSTAPITVRPYIGSPPIFRNDDEFKPLQAADLYAGAMRRHAYENARLYMPMRWELKELQDLQNIERQINATELCEWLSSLPSSTGRR
jgi:hypothetical protein